MGKYLNPCLLNHFSIHTSLDSLVVLGILLLEGVGGYSFLGRALYSFKLPVSPRVFKCFASVDMVIRAHVSQKRHMLCRSRIAYLGQMDRSLPPASADEVVVDDCWVINAWREGGSLGMDISRPLMSRKI